MMASEDNNNRIEITSKSLENELRNFPELDVPENLEPKLLAEIPFSKVVLYQDTYTGPHTEVPGRADCGRKGKMC